MKTLIFAFLLLAFPALAQEDAKAAQRSFRIAVSALPQGMGDTVFHLAPSDAGLQPAAISISLYRFSKPVPLAEGQLQLPLYQKAPTQTESGAFLPGPDTTVALPAGARRILVVLFPRKTDDGFALGAHAIDEARFPSGSIYFFNPTKIHVGAVLGEEKIRIAAGTSHLFEAPSLGKGKTLGVQISLHQEEGWKLFSSTRWHLTPRERHLVFFKTNPRTKKPDYDSLTDYLEERPASLAP